MIEPFVLERRSGAALVPACVDDSSAHSQPAMSPAARTRLRTAFQANFSSVWRVLRRLGVPPDAVDDAAQQVFLVAATKMGAIVVGSERAFLLGTAVRVAAAARRPRARRREITDEDIDEHPDSAPNPEQLANRKRSLLLLDEVLEAMPDELRAVFVLFEIEGMTSYDIAPLLELRRGTVVSRLKRAREHFASAAKRLRAKRQLRGGEP